MIKHSPKVQTSDTVLGFTHSGNTVLVTSNAAGLWQDRNGKFIDIEFWVKPSDISSEMLDQTDQTEDEEVLELKLALEPFIKDGKVVTEVKVDLDEDDEINIKIGNVDIHLETNSDFSWD